MLHEDIVDGSSDTRICRECEKKGKIGKRKAQQRQSKIVAERGIQIAFPGPVKSLQNGSGFRNSGTDWTFQ